MFRAGEGTVERLEGHIQHVHPCKKLRLQLVLSGDGRGVLIELDDSVTDIRMVLKSLKELCGQIVANEIEYGRD